MRTITDTFNVYTFDELSDTAKEYAKDGLKDVLRDNDCFYDDIKYQLSEKFPNSELDIQYSFSCCQGDGVNVYGKLVLSDIANIILVDINKYTEDKELTEKEVDRYRRFLENIKHENGYCNIKLECNDRYTYSLKNMNHFVEDTVGDIIDNIYSYWIEVDEKTRKIITVFAENIQTYFSEYENQIKSDGDDYFLDEIDDDEAQEYCNDNGYWFYEDGKFYDCV